MMADQVDYYHEILAIPPSEQPPHHYRLLSISLFEDNANVIANAAARQMRYIRDLAIGDYADISQRLLNEVAEAKLCLLDPQRREAYDEQLRREIGTDVPTSVRSHMPKPSIPAGSWTIGTDPGCDLVVQSQYVSRLHARLTTSSEGITIEDIQSTNGIYVNGLRVARRMTVTPDDVITLGKRVPLPWPNSLHGDSAPGRVLAIGRSEHNDVVIDHPSVSAIHALITIRDREITLEDLGSTNGTAVHSPQEKICRCVLTGDETVYLGQHEVSVAELIQ